jgi:uncharacterized membrane protein HdeD (DUF308 family)
VPREVSFGKARRRLNGEQKTESARTGAPPNWFRGLEVLLGLASVVVSVVILANPNYQTEDLVLLLSGALLFSAIRTIAAGGLRKRLAMLERAGLLGVGLLAALILVLVIFLPGLSYETLVFLFAISLTAQGVGRIIPSTRKIEPRWLRGSAFATGALAIALAAVAVLVPNIAALTLVPLFSAVVLVSGVEMIVWGLRPTDPRQLTLLKLILFSAFYGLILVNWIDLFATSAPAYHIWLILTYMAPFGVLIVFQGLKDWQLALSLGLLVSLMNDVGYYFIGDLLFGFHQALVPWVEGQLGFLGSQLLFTFQGGAFTIPVTSTLMGISIYARVAVVVVILNHWWRHPSGL